MRTQRRREVVDGTQMWQSEASDQGLLPSVRPLLPPVPPRTSSADSELCESGVSVLAVWYCTRIGLNTR